MKFLLSRFVANKNDFWQKFTGVATGKDFAARFVLMWREASSLSTSTRPATVVTMSKVSEMLDDEHARLHDGLKTPTKKN